MNDNYPPGVSDSTINRHFGEEHECEAGPRGINGRARCVHCDTMMEDSGDE